MPLESNSPVYRRRLERYLASFGVRFVAYTNYPEWRLEVFDNDDLLKAPFTGGLAVRWEPKEIHYYGAMPWPSILHEAGHLLCSTVPPNHGDSEDISFLGWELALVRHLRLPMKQWHKNNTDYGIAGSAWQSETDLYDEIGQIPFGKTPFRRFVRYYIEDAQKRGLVSATETPQSVVQPS